MSYARFENLLERTMGLKAASIGVSAIERAIGGRLRACGLDHIDAYWTLLLGSHEELQALIEAVVVPETWFFRDAQAFKAMVRRLSDQRLTGDATRPFRLLSLPCSTGEEPYTMAMALLDAGLPTERFKIDAVDISTHALSQARLGIYGRNSFRADDLAFRDRYFKQVERGFRLNETVCEPVRFVQGNMLDADFLRDAEPYDIIFCRNLLIYFDPPTQSRAINVLQRLLAPQGMLFVGHSEPGLMSGRGLVSAKIPMAFAFLKASTLESQPKVQPKMAPPPAQRTAIAARPTAPRMARMPAFKRDKAPAPTERPGIDELRRIADCGRLEEAAKGCEAHMRECGPSPDGFLLLGLISDAGGDPSAAALYYRKALYLEPAHAEALGHLALLLKKQGDHAGAKLLDDRMRRQEERRAR